MDKIEIWKDIPGNEGHYQVSNLGNARSIDKYVFNGNGYYLRKGRALILWKNRKGYETIKLPIKAGVSKRKSFLIHRIIAKIFIPNPENKEQVNHKDLNKLNNSVENLEWNTNAENMAHAILNKAMKKARGEGCKQSSLTNEKIYEIRSSSLSKIKLAEIYNVSRVTISCIKLRKTWKHI